ncbi:DNA-binding transcriptional regulator HipB [Escherichia coli]|uniref:DNA-binding transcriptional regulator HipB n=1 Tax=Escherichia coli TaxID=562 RepID=A0A376KU51_ECOLX|nr:DNA-binding transcriptional regulator HipB [Escherichia coli]
MMSFQKIYSPTQLANAMKLVRQQNGWTQSELAKKIGIKQATISNFENNPDNTTLTTFFKILQSLELSMTLCDTKNASPESTETARSGVVMPKLCHLDEQPAGRRVNEVSPTARTPLSMHRSG